MKKLKILLVVFSFIFVVGCSKEELGEKITYDGITYQETSKKTNTVVINLENEDKILIELYPDIAPKTVANFKKLVSEDFYSDLIFHRVIKDFMIQGGDGTSLGKSASTIPGEFSENGFSNHLDHTRGVISMARTNDPNSASSQFFIVHQDSPHLNGKYASFGKVIAGISSVDKIASSVTDSNDKPIKEIKMKNIKFIKVVSENE